MAGTAVTDMADTTGSAGASPADLFLTESEASDVAQKPVPIVPPPAAASGRPAEAGSRIAADSQSVNTAKAAAFRRPSIASAAQLAAGRHRQASGVFRGFRLQQPTAAGLPVPSHHQVAHGPVADRSCSWFNSTPCIAHQRQCRHLMWARYACGRHFQALIGDISLSRG